MSTESLAERSYPRKLSIIDDLFHGNLIQKEKYFELNYVGISDFLDTPKGVRDSLIIQYADEDRRLLREIMLPFVYRRGEISSAENIRIEIYTNL